MDTSPHAAATAVDHDRALAQTPLTGVSIPERFVASENALEVFKRRYASTRDDGSKETAEEALRRVAKALAGVEVRYGHSMEEAKQWEEEFYGIMVRREFTPAGRTLTNAGTPYPLIANCIVLHIEDSMDSIFSTLRDASLLQQAGSGLGFPLHLMRPAGSNTRRSQGQASGPLSFLRVYNQSFGVIKQQNRHGANMAVMRVDHPDILEFVHAKEKEGDIKNFNISVGLTNKFMSQVESNDPAPWMCEWKGEAIKPRRIVRGADETAITIEEMNMTAREMFQEIIEAAWKNGEPGCVFLDEVNRTNPLPGLGRIEACNPCGEQFLHDGDVCNLGSINLEEFVTADRQVDVRRLTDVARISTRLLDNVVDVSDFPAQRVNTVARANRRVGLGIMGFADMLLKMHVPYDSDEGRATAELVMSTIQQASHQMSQELATEKGVFPNWDKSIYKEQNIPMRNAALTNIAPTGTISMFFDVSGGVEPYFALAYFYKGILGGNVQLQYVNKHLEAALKERGLFSEELMAKIINEGSLQNIPEIPEELKRIFVVAMDISPQDHTRMQAAFQKHIDNAISKTINFPNDATQDDVLNGYILAWQLGCKGCTVYRDGSRDLQILNLNKTKDEAPASTTTTETMEQVVLNAATLAPRSRPDVLSGTTYKVHTAYGNLYITVNDDESGKPFEVFASIGKSGGFFASQSEAICRLISVSLRAGVDPSIIIDQLKGIRSPDISWHDGGQIHSLADAIGQILDKHVRHGVPQQLHLGYEEQVKLDEPDLLKVESTVTVHEERKVSLADLGYAPACPECHNTLTMTEGCMSCKNCGYSKCG